MLLRVYRCILKPLPTHVSKHFQACKSAMEVGAHQGFRRHVSLSLQHLGDSTQFMLMISRHATASLLALALQTCFILLLPQQPIVFPNCEHESKPMHIAQACKPPTETCKNKTDMSCPYTKKYMLWSSAISARDTEPFCAPQGILSHSVPRKGYCAKDKEVGCCSVPLFHSRITCPKWCDISFGHLRTFYSRRLFVHL
jgi:hypothetical protein